MSRMTSRTNSLLAIPLVQARKIIKDLDIREPDELDLDLIAAHFDILVLYEELKGSDGCLVRKGSEAVISVNSLIREEGKRRFVVAHELGHYFLHPDIRQIDLCKERDIDRWSYNNDPQEAEANYFAAELLMTEWMFLPRIEGEVPSFEIIKKIATEFRTTVCSTAIRFVNMTKEPCALMASEKMEWKWFVANEQFNFLLREERRIDRYTCAAEIFGGKSNAIRENRVPAASWLRDYDDNSKECITEDSIRLGNYGLVLSLLWIEEAI